MVNGRSKKLILNLLYAFGANGITMLVSLLTTLVLPRFVSIEEYGYSQLYIFYTNYIGFLRKAMYDAGFKDIPVVSLSINGIEKNGIMKNVTLQLINRLFMSVIYGDLLMKVL